MSSGPKDSGKSGDPRQERLARALRDNLKKRKAQQRERRQGDGQADGPRDEQGEGDKDGGAGGRS